MAHDPGKVPFGCLQQQVIMIAHKAKDMDPCAITLGCRFQISKEFFSVLFALEHILVLITSGGNMIKSTGILYS